MVIVHLLSKKYGVESKGVAFHFDFYVFFLTASIEKYTIISVIIDLGEARVEWC